MHKNKKQIRRLWKTVFGDSDKFIRLFFNKVYKEENALVIERDGQVVSSLQLLPYTMTYYGEEIPVAYISGACTLPAEQGKGLMKQLLRNASDEMKRRGIAVSILIPAESRLFDYYRAQGYTEIFEYSLKVYTRSEYLAPKADGIIVQCRKKPDEETFAYFDRKLRERPMGILHTYDDFAIILNDLNISGGQWWVAFDSGRQPVGMAFVSTPETNATSGKGSVLIKEILCENDRVKQRLLYEISIRYNLLKAVYRIPFGNSRAAWPYGMAQVTDSERLINLWAAAHPESKLSAADMRAMNIHKLTRHLLGYSERMAYMSLMLD
jgi:predicted N-acetyltransferase YhbS